MEEQKPSNQPKSISDGNDSPGDDAVIGRALRWSLIVFAVIAMVIGGVVFALRMKPKETGKKKEYVKPADVRARTEATLPEIPFVDITEAAGIDFVHHNGALGNKLLPETMGGGCAFLDYDGDGHQDILLINSSNWTEQNLENEPTPTMGLYRNDGSGQFNNVTKDVNLDVSNYGMGTAVGDFDNDGDADIFVSAVGENRLFENRDGMFHDITAAAGVAGDPESWSTSCLWLDYDNDGDLDLFVCNYVQWSAENDLAQGFQLVGVGRAYGPPTGFAGTFPYLYENDGDGTFTDVSERSGIQVRNEATGEPMAKALGVVAVDVDGDGWLDLIVANDTVRNCVFRNQRDGTFSEIGTTSGVAYDSSGKARGAMGIDTAWFRNDATLGIAIGNFANEMAALYVSQGDDAQFADEAIASGLGPQTRLSLTFGLFFFDADLDSRLDVLAANGHLEEEINKVQQSQRYRQPAQLFWNAGADGATEFVPLSEKELGADLFQPIVGRGAAYADIDSDGDLDVLLTQIGGRPLLLRNDQVLGNHWLRFKLRGQASNRDAIGAVVVVELDELIVLRRQVMPTRSYLSQVELPVTFGLGPDTEVDGVSVIWPDGTRQAVEGFELDSLNDVRQAPR